MWEKRCGLIAAVLSLYTSCNHGLEAEGADPVGISGRVRFVGEWPGDVAQVAVAVFREPPASLADFFNFSGRDTDVPLGVGASALGVGASTSSSSSSSQQQPGLVSKGGGGFQGKDKAA